MFSKTFAPAVGLLVATSTLVAFSGHGHHRHHQPVCSCCEACPATCQVKVCRVKEEVSKVAKTKFSCECEDFCIPGKSTYCGTECDCSSGCNKCKKIWKPGCGQVRTRLVLKKSTEEEEVVKYTWEVVDACSDCAATLEQESAKNEEAQKKEADKKDQGKKDEKKKDKKEKGQKQNDQKEKNDRDTQDAVNNNGDAPQDDAKPKREEAGTDPSETKAAPSARASGRRRVQATRANTRVATLARSSGSSR